MTNIACHPRVAQLRGYPRPVKASLPKEYVQVTPKTYRSGIKRAASVDYREQLAVMIGAGVGRKSVTRITGPVAPAPPLQSPRNESNYRVPFRNTQNNSTEPIEFHPLFPVLDSITKGHSHGLPFPLSPQNKRTPEKGPRPLRSINYKGLRISPPPIPSTPSYAGQSALRSPSHPSSTSRGVFPSGFVDDVNGYSAPSGFSLLYQPTRERGAVQTHFQNEHDDFMYMGNDDMDEMDEHPARPGSRMGFYPSHSGYHNDDDAMDDSGPVWVDDGDGDSRDLEEEQEVEEMILEERDISEANPFDFDSDVEEDDAMEMTRELIKILDFQ